LVIAPFLGIASLTIVRSKLLDFDKGLTDEQFKALWTFIGAGLAASATVLGTLLTTSHNKRTLAIQKEADDRKQILENEAAERLKVDTAISGLSLVSQDGKYAPKASIAGGLASLVHLGHPNIAMRVLGAALTDDAVDGDTAAWLLGQILISDVTTGTAEDLVRAKREAGRNSAFICASPNIFEPTRRLRVAQLRSGGMAPWTASRSRVKPGQSICPVACVAGDQLVA
jgi:hypothetical protein